MLKRLYQIFLGLLEILLSETKLFAFKIMFKINNNKIKFR